MYYTFGMTYCFKQQNIGTYPRNLANDTGIWIHPMEDQWLQPLRRAKRDMLSLSFSFATTSRSLFYPDRIGVIHLVVS